MVIVNPLLTSWFWLLVISIVLFVTFIILIETNQDAIDNNTIANWVWLVLLMTLAFAITAFLVYYFTTPNLNACNLPCRITQEVLVHQVANPCVDPCNLEPVCNIVDETCKVLDAETCCLKPVVDVCPVKVEPISCTVTVSQPPCLPKCEPVCLPQCTPSLPQCIPQCLPQCEPVCIPKCPTYERGKIPLTAMNPVF